MIQKTEFSNRLLEQYAHDTSYPPACFINAFKTWHSLDVIDKFDNFQALLAS